MEIYRHRQFGKVSIFSLGLAAALILIVTEWLPSSPGSAVATVVLGILLASLVLFHSLSVAITPERVAVWFGIGLIRRTFRTLDIRDARAVRNPWYYGWGVRLTPHGWMFNVSGLDAVELELRDGRRFRIGTDEPDRLVAALRQVIGPGG